MDSCTGSVKRELANRDAHAIDAKITEPQNATAVGDDCDFDIVRPVLDYLVQMAAIFVGEVEACRVLLAAIAPLSLKKRCRPSGWVYSSDHLWQASPTVGV